jgi:hypothetical protein
LNELLKPPSRKFEKSSRKSEKTSSRKSEKTSSRKSEKSLRKSGKSLSKSEKISKCIETITKNVQNKFDRGELMVKGQLVTNPETVKNMIDSMVDKICLSKKS